MSNDAQIRGTIQRAFANCRRPGHFTNFNHCEECAEHDAMLRARDHYTLRMEDVGNLAEDPICFISPEGFAYYLPAFARLALSKPQEPFDWYGAKLLSHLCSDGRGNARLLACTPEQRKAVVLLLQHLIETRSQLVDEYGVADDLFQALEIWSDSSVG